MSRVRVCNGTVYHHNKPWVSFAAAEHYRPVVDDVFELGYKSPFEVRIGETVFLRDDGSLSLPFVRRNRILFPAYECGLR